VGVLARTIARGHREGSIDPNLSATDGGRLIVGAAYLIAQMKLSGRSEDEVTALVDTLVRVFAGSLAPGGARPAVGSNDAGAL
jgi:hypothetical protein